MSSSQAAQSMTARAARRSLPMSPSEATASPPSAISPAPARRRASTPRGMAVAPGFINMLSWATESLIEDGRSQSDIRQGVTLEVMGEGESMGPINDGDARRR